MVHVGSLISLLVFYFVILIIGLVAAWKKTRRPTNSIQGASETLIVAHRDINRFVGMFTMTAVWVGGGYITGTSEGVFKLGLLWCQAPVGYSLSLILGGLFFAKPMRDNRYVTMLDPFQVKYGQVIGALMYIPALIGEIFWSAAILASLGAAISVIAELEFKIAVIISCAVAVLYTFFGGQYSVCYTDVAQLILIVFGLLLCTPFAWHSEYVAWNSNDNGTLVSTVKNETNFTDNVKNETNFTVKVPFEPGDWIGTIETKDIPRYIDDYLLLILGGIPWQDYFQRVLSAKSTRNAQFLSIIGGVCCFILAFPSVIIGYVARYTDWDKAGKAGHYSNENVRDNASLILPLVLQYLTPKVVACFGLGAVAAGVMSSTDASVLSSSSMFTHNIYRTIIRPKASDKETVWVLRVGFVVAGTIAAVTAIYDQSVYLLWVFCSDFVYVILFPQLVCVLYCNFVNAYGVISGSVISIILRILGGEEALWIPPILKYPGFDYDNNKQLFPFKTFATLINFVITCVVSRVMTEAIKKWPKIDILKISNRPRNSISSIHPAENNVECKVMKFDKPGIGHYFK